MLKYHLKKLILNAEVFFPAISEFEFCLLSLFRRCLKRPHESAFAAIKWLGVRNGAVLLDVGGGLGQSVASMRLYSDSAKIICFEPNPSCARKIRRRFGNDPALELETLALGNTNGIVPMYMPVYRNVAFPDLGTLNRSDAEDWLAPRVYGYDPNSFMLLEMPCKCCRLDDLKLKPELIKIDSRCNSLAVIEGATKTIAEHQPALIVEGLKFPKEMFKWLASLNYTFCQVERMALVEVNDMNQPCDLLLTGNHLARPGMMRWLERSRK